MKENYRIWSENETQYLIGNVLLDTANRVVNAIEVANELSRSEQSVIGKIGRCRKNGLLPQIDPTMQIDSYKRQYTDTELNRIKLMYDTGSTAQEIADCFDRSLIAIQSLICRKGWSNKLMPWSKEDVGTLLSHIKFDKYGYVCNYYELQKLLKRPTLVIRDKVKHLRRQRKILVLPDRTHASEKASQMMKEFNDLRFAFLLGRQKKTDLDGRPNQSKTNLTKESIT